MSASLLGILSRGIENLTSMNHSRSVDVNLDSSNITSLIQAIFVAPLMVGWSFEDM